MSAISRGPDVQMARSSLRANLCWVEKTTGCLFGSRPSHSREEAIWLSVLVIWGFHMFVGVR